MTSYFRTRQAKGETIATMIDGAVTSNVTSKSTEGCPLNAILRLGGAGLINMLERIVGMPLIAAKVLSPYEVVKA